MEKMHYGLEKFDESPLDDQSVGTEKERSEIRVLVAEDNDISREIVCDLLSHAGFKTEQAENGRVCADMFRLSEAGYYSVILMDVRMPVMNGYEAAAEIRSLKERPDSGIPIIAITADNSKEDTERCLGSGMNHYIVKPIDIQEVINIIGELI